MDCQSCGYSLMNLTGGKCPECGLAFDLRSYHFEPGRVAFACPHCDHQHSGQGDHYQPAQEDKAVCRACGKHMPMALIRVVPLADDAKARWLRQTPWESGVRSQRLNGLRRTCLMSLFQPSTLGELLGMRPRAWWAVSFSIACCGLVSIVWGLLTLGAVLIFTVLDRIPSIAGKMTDLSAIFLEGFLFVGASPWMLFQYLLLTIPVIHIILTLTGKTQSGFLGTMSAVAYGHGPVVLCLLPGIGLPVAFIWTIYSTICIVSAAQKVSYLRAAMACLVLPVILFSVPVIYALYKLAAYFA